MCVKEGGNIDPDPDPGLCAFWPGLITPTNRHTYVCGAVETHFNARRLAAVERVLEIWLE